VDRPRRSAARGDDLTGRRLERLERTARTAERVPVEGDVEMMRTSRMAAAARAWIVPFRGYLPDVHMQLVDLSLVEPVHIGECPPARWVLPSLLQQLLRVMRRGPIPKCDSLEHPGADRCLIEM
jgi:hypothetical protein